MLLDGLISLSGGKWHEDHAVVWLNHNVPASQSVLSFNMPILYRTGRLTAERFNSLRDAQIQSDALELDQKKSWAAAMADQNWSDYDYFVVSLGRKSLNEEKEIDNILGREPIKCFVGSRGAVVLIYQVKNA